MSWMNFNDAEQQRDMGEPIPAGTIVKVHMKIRPGGYNDPDPSKGWTGGYAKRSDTTGAVMLDCEFTVIGGDYNKRKVWSNVGLYSPKGPKWGEMGRAFLRAAIESARGIDPNDASEAAMKARVVNGLADLDGLEFAARVDIEEGQNGYGDKNVIQTVVGVKHKRYAEVMAGGGSAPVAQPMPAPQASGQGKPAWAQ